MILNLDDFTNPPITSEQKRGLFVDITVGTFPGFKEPICNIRDPDAQYAVAALLEFQRLFDYAVLNRITSSKFLDSCRYNRNYAVLKVYEKYKQTHNNKPPREIFADIKRIILAIESGVIPPDDQSFVDLLFAERRPGGGTIKKGKKTRKSKTKKTKRRTQINRKKTKTKRM